MPLRDIDGMSVSRGEFEGAVNLLLELDKTIEDLRVRTEKARRELVELARREIDSSREEVLRSVRRAAEELSRRILDEAKREAEGIILRGKNELENLKRRMDKNFDEAIAYAMEVLLGRKRS